MAGSRLEKVGTIFARMNGLLKKNVLPMEEKPIWYEIYALHPPHIQPRYDQEAPVQDVRELLYEEDLIRAKYHEKVRFHEVINLNDRINESRTKKFINIYVNLKAQGGLDDEKVFEVALEQLDNTREEKFNTLIDEVEEPISFGQVKSFTEATQAAEKNNTNEKPKPIGKSSINIKTLF